VHEVVPEELLDDAVKRIAGEVLTASPSGVAATKALLAEVSQTRFDDTLEMTARAIARQRVSEEGQEGLRAFLERRKPTWTA
jgi:methylglutaconyl-CoA hydratase